MNPISRIFNNSLVIWFFSYFHTAKKPPKIRITSSKRTMFKKHTFLPLFDTTYPTKPNFLKFQYSLQLSDNFFSKYKNSLYILHLYRFPIRILLPNLLRPSPMIPTLRISFLYWITTTRTQPKLLLLLYPPLLTSLSHPHFLSTNLYKFLTPITIENTINNSTSKAISISLIYFPPHCSLSI